MFLGENEIRRMLATGQICIDPFDPVRDSHRIGPNSVDLTLSEHILEFDQSRIFLLGEDQPKPDRVLTKYPILLQPGKFYLGSTVEWTECRGLVPRLDGKSSRGRMSVEVHRTAGFGDHGFRGQWTLEIATLVNVVIPRPFMRICQISFQPILPEWIIELMIKSPERQGTYEGRYQDQRGIQPAKADPR